MRAWFLAALMLFLAASVALAASDSTPPTTSLNLSGTIGANSWYTSGVDISLVASDLESGVKSINYKLDSGPWQEEEFLGTLNRVQNPSFEDGSLFSIDKWYHPYYPELSALFFRAPLQARFGSKSAGIIAAAPGTYYWHNEPDYMVVEVGKIYTASAWVKTALLMTGNCYFEIWSKNSTGPDTLVSTSSSTSGVVAWTRLSLTFSPPAGSTGVYFHLVSNINSQIGSVYWDGCSLTEETETGTQFTVGVSGQHHLEYYSIDNAGNEESPHLTSDFKIDTSAPSGWKNFSRVRTLNDHTYKCSISVSDFVSGIDVSTAAYQYTYDGGETWSPWLSTVTVNPSVDGSQTVVITTTDVDFHDSNWNETKIIRFRIADMAGQVGVSPDQVLNGAWIKTVGGDVYVRGAVSMRTSAPELNSTGVLISDQSSVSNFSNQGNWQVLSYSGVSRPTYAEWYADHPSTSPLPSGKLPLVSGRYISGAGDFIVDNRTIPNSPGADLANTPNLAAVIYVPGNLTVATDLVVHPTSIILFIVAGDCRVAEAVENLSASFFVDGSFDTSYDQPPPQDKLVINGTVASSDLVLRRSLGRDDNFTTPVEQFNYPGTITQLSSLLGEGGMVWEEVP